MQSQRPPQAPSNENAEASTAGGDQRPDAGRLQQLQVRAVQLGLVRTLQAELERETIELEENAGQSDEASDRDQISAAANRQRDLAALVGSVGRRRRDLMDRRILCAAVVLRCAADPSC